MDIIGQYGQTWTNMDKLGQTRTTWTIWINMDNSQWTNMDKQKHGHWTIWTKLKIVDKIDNIRKIRYLEAR